MSRCRKPGETIFTVYMDGKRRYTYFGTTEEEIVEAEIRAMTHARSLWDRSEHRAEVTVILYDDTRCDAIQHWFPVTSYGSGSLYLAAKMGRLLSFRQGNKRFGYGYHPLSVNGEQRYLDLHFGPTEAILETFPHVSQWVERRRDASGQTTIVGRGVDVTSMIVGRPAPDPATLPTVSDWMAKMGIANANVTG